VYQDQSCKELSEEPAVHYRCTFGSTPFSEVALELNVSRTKVCQYSFAIHGSIDLLDINLNWLTTASANGLRCFAAQSIVLLLSEPLRSVIEPNALVGLGDSDSLCLSVLLVV
jgi:hypothetical protein